MEYYYYFDRYLILNHLKIEPHNLRYLELEIDSLVLI